MIAETLAIPVKFNHICFCQWHPATRCQEFTTPLFSLVTSLFLQSKYDFRVCVNSYITHLAWTLTLLTLLYWYGGRVDSSIWQKATNYKCEATLCWYSTFLSSSGLFGNLLRDSNCEPLTHTYSSLNGWIPVRDLYFGMWNDHAIVSFAKRFCYEKSN